MIKKIILLSAILGVALIGIHTNWIEELFNLNYCVGEVVDDFLVYCILVVLCLRKGK